MLVPAQRLDAPPPRPRDVRKQPGDDTRALLGDSMNADPAGVSLSSPGGRLNAAVMMLMQAANEIQSQVPGDPQLPQLIQLVSYYMDTVPQLVASMQQQPNPQQLLATIGMAGAGSGMGQMGMAAAIPPSQSMPMSEGPYGRPGMM